MTSQATATLAPIAIFVFKRPTHLLGTLNSLADNPEFLSSPLYVFSDQGRNPNEQVLVDEVRQIVRDFPHPNKILVEAEKNKGLALSITTGVTQLAEQYGKVIVVEDDLIVSPHFLNYMNTALTRYADDANVMQISGHMFPVEVPTKDQAFFMPFTTSWGWATWQRAWVHMKMEPEEATQKLKSRCWRYQFDIRGSYPYARMLSERLKGNNNSWAIWWYYQVFKQQGLTLYPSKSLVNNDGFDGSGTHCGNVNVIQMQFEGLPITRYPQVTYVSAYCDRVRYFLRKERGLKRNVYDLLWRLFLN